MMRKKFFLKANYLAKFRLEVNLMREGLTNKFIYSRRAKYKSHAVACMLQLNQATSLKYFKNICTF